MAAATSRVKGDRSRWKIARDVVDGILADQITRGESLHSGAGILAGLAGVITTLAGTSIPATQHTVGRIGLSLSGLSAVVAVAVLLLRRPGREPSHLRWLVEQVLDTGDLEVTEDALLTVDLGAVDRNETRLAWKGGLVVISALVLASAISVFVIAIIAT